jgi:POT family proton-dependent oligopeptide transporter
MSEVKTGQPQGLMTLFFSEMWERFCYYGMRTLLTLYLVKSLMKGDADASIIYGAYTALVYAAPILGGRMADQFLGYRYAVILGAILIVMSNVIGVGRQILRNQIAKKNLSSTP